MKKIDKLIDAIGSIDDKYIEEAHSNIKKKKYNFMEYINWSNFGKLALAGLSLLLIINIIPNIFPSYENTSPDSYYEYQDNGASAPSYAYKDEANYSSEETIITNESNNEIVDNKKMILTANLSLSTQNLDDVVDELLNNVNKYNGYIQSSSTYTSSYNNRKYEATIRIPAKDYQEFINQLKTSSNVVRYSEELEDITEQYSDLEARINSLKAQEAKVLEFYEHAESIEDLMSIESRLSELRYQIEAYETRIKNYDLLINYSTLYLTIDETKIFVTEKTSFIKRLGISFISGASNLINNIENLLIDIAYNIWTIILLLIIGFIGYKIFKRLKNRKKQ